MSPQTPRATSARAPATARKLPKERANFKQLLLANHFGTIAGSSLKAEAAPKGDTAYEQLMCVGYNPDLKRLDAVVYIKQDNGYLGGLCTAGSREYVKFFASHDNGSTWTNLGQTSFTVWDVSGKKPLEFDATLPNVDLAEECCREENLVLVRAILSWEVPPGGPDDPVVWGNALDATIQVAPLKWGPLSQFFKCLKIELPLLEATEIADIEQQVAFGVPKKLTPLELHKAYHGQNVPPHRYLLTHVQELLESPQLLTANLAQKDFEIFPGLGKEIDISKLIGLIIDPNGNETYESIGCIGLNENSKELVATVDVKLSSGYSGNLCTNGSQEYVAFWVDWEDGSGLHYAGTASVNVHDVASMPKDGLRYSVALPFAQIYTHRQPCEHGPKTALIRAVLAWATPPSTTDPYAVPVWGGHRETRILIPPGDPVVGGGPVLEYIGSVYTPDILSTGLAKVNAASINGWNTTHESPFGGSLSLGGVIINPVTGDFGGPGYEYRILYSVNGGAWTHISQNVPIRLLNMTTLAITPHTLTPDLNGWMPYLEDHTGFPHEHVVADVLAYFASAGDGDVRFILEARDAMMNPLGSTPPIKVKLDNTLPDDAIWITSGGGSCGDFKIGDPIDGAYWASDNEGLGSLSFTVEPFIGGGSFTHAPTTSTLTFEDGTWQLDTTGMTACGYVIALETYDRTIVSDTPVGWHKPAFVGFCLKK